MSILQSYMAILYCHAVFQDPYILGADTSKTHILGAVLCACEPVAQLAIIVAAPALEGVFSQDHARMVRAQGDDDCWVGCWAGQ